MTGATKPSLAIVFGHFSTVAQMSDWGSVEQFANPCGFFHTVHVLALGDDREYPGYEFGSVRVHRIRSLIPNAHLKRLNDALLMLLGTAYLSWLVKRFDVDLIAQIDSTPLKYGLPAVVAARLTGLPSLITLQSDYHKAEQFSLSTFLRWISHLLWPYVFRTSTRVRSVSRPIAEFALEHGVPREKIAIIPNKENLVEFRDRPSAELLDACAKELGVQELVRDSLVILSVARLIQIKNLQRCLKAFASVQEQYPDLAYLIVGTGPLLTELKELARSLGVADRVRFLGYFAHASLARIYHLSDVFLFPTLYEGHPRVVLEALAAQLPIICSNHGVVTEMVRADDGIHVDPTDVGQISEAILRLATNREERAELSRHSSFDPEAYSLEAVNKLEAALYAEMIREACA